MRKADRIVVDEPARLHPNSWSSLEVRLIDCSETGFRAYCEARVGVADLVTIEIPGIGPVEAHISWRRDREFGARFLDPIDLARAELAGAGQETLLARLLVQRAAAHRANQRSEEQALRRKILQSLPMRRG